MKWYYERMFSPEQPEIPASPDIGGLSRERDRIDIEVHRLEEKIKQSQALKVPSDELEATLTALTKERDDIAYALMRAKNASPLEEQS